MEQQPRPQEPAADKGVGSVDDPTEYVPPGPPPIPDYPPAECSFPDNLWVDDAQVDPFADIPDRPVLFEGK